MKASEYFKEFFGHNYNEPIDSITCIRFAQSYANKCLAEKERTNNARERYEKAKRTLTWDSRLVKQMNNALLIAAGLEPHIE